MKTEISTKDLTALQIAVLNQLGFDLDNRELNEDDAGTLSDIANNSADAGWSGFTYYTDTVAFFNANKRAILKLAEEMASDLGEDMLAIIAGFGCLKDDKLTASQIMAAIYDADDENETTVKNAFAWFALEETARSLANQ